MFCRTCGMSLVGVPEPAKKVAALGGTVAVPPPPQPALPRPAAAAPAPSPGAPPSPVGAPPTLAAAEPQAQTGQFAPVEVRPEGRIVMLAKDGSDAQSWSITSEAMDLGAKEGHVVLTADPFLSPRHARLAKSGGSFAVHDLGSVNRVYIRLRTPRPLLDGDLILLGQQVLRFEAVNDAEQALRPALQHGTALFGTPQAPVHARLCQRTVEGITRDVFHMTRPELTLGREQADVVFTDDAFLSRRHAIIRRTADGGFVIEDLGSSNGTFVAIRGHNPLTDGDILRMGLHMFRIELFSHRSPRLASSSAASDQEAKGSEAGRA